MIIELFFLYALSAGSFTIAKAVLSYAQPLFFVAFRMIVAGLILLTLVHYKKGIALGNIRQSWKLFLSIIFVHIYLAFTLDILALTHMSSAKGAFIYMMAPFITALFSYFYFGERMSRKKWLGMGIGFLGFLPQLWWQIPGQSTAFFTVAIADFYMIGSVIASVIGWLIVRHLLLLGYDSLLINGIGMIGGGCLALINSAVVESGQPMVSNWPYFLYLTGMLIVMVNMVGYNLYADLLKRYTATFLSFTSFLSPLFAAFFGWLFLAEALQWHFFFSLLVVILGLAIFYNEELKREFASR